MQGEGTRGAGPCSTAELMPAAATTTATAAATAAVKNGGNNARPVQKQGRAKKI